MGRSDWEYVFNTFAFGYAIGYRSHLYLFSFSFLPDMFATQTDQRPRFSMHRYHFIERAAGSMNGNFLGIGADLMVNASVQVRSSGPKDQNTSRHIRTLEP